MSLNVKIFQCKNCMYQNVPSIQTIKNSCKSTQPLSLHRSFPLEREIPLTVFPQIEAGLKYKPGLEYRPGV